MFLVGATVDLKYVATAGGMAVLLVIGALLFRMFGVAIPLSMGLNCGNIVLTVAVLSILITAPFGAVCIDNLYKKLLEKNI